MRLSLLVSPPSSWSRRRSRRRTAPSAPAPGVAGRRLAERNAGRYDDTFKRYSKRYFGAGFDWRYFKAQGMAESGLDPPHAAMSAHAA